MSKIATISTVKAPKEVLMEFVNYHLKIGINKVILFFDDPEDKAIKSFVNNVQVHSYLCTKEYWGNENKHKPESIEERQLINVNNGVKIAESIGCDWIIHIDSDELIFNSMQHPINKTLENSNADIIRLAVREAIADQPYPESIFQAKWFKKPIKQERINKAISLGCKNVLFEGDFFRGHLESKAFVRISPKVFRYGIHLPIDYDSTTVINWNEEIKLLHFDCIGFDSWKLKWNRRLDGTATAKKMRKNRKIQLQKYQLAKKGGDSGLLKLYKQLHMVSRKDKVVLWLLGMLERINIRA